MLIPLFLSLCSHGKPIAPRSSAHAGNHKTAPHRSGRGRSPLIRTLLIRTAIKGDIQFVMLAPPSPFGPAAPQSFPSGSPAGPALSPPRRLMPLTTSLRLDTRAEEEQEESDLIAAINNERTGRGLEPLTEDLMLNATARSHSREMCSLGYFDHHSPTGGQETPMDRYLAGLRAWGEGRPEVALVGENIFYASATDSIYNITYANASLMNSPGHRANILEPRFTKVGVGLYRDSRGRFWVTEMFLRDME